MRKTFTDKFNEEQKVEEEVSKAWGYATSPSHLSNLKDSKRTEK